MRKNALKTSQNTMVTHFILRNVRKFTFFIVVLQPLKSFSPLPPKINYPPFAAYEYVKQ